MMDPTLQAVLDSVLTALGTALTALIILYVPKIVAAFETRAHVELTAQQIQSLQAAATTAASSLTAKLRVGLLHPEHAIDPTSEAVRAAALAALSRVPDSAMAQGVTVSGMAEVIAARVDPATERAVRTPVPVLVPKG